MLEVQHYLFLWCFLEARIKTGQESLFCLSHLPSVIFRLELRKSLEQVAESDLMWELTWSQRLRVSAPCCCQAHRARLTHSPLMLAACLSSVDYSSLIYHSQHHPCLIHLASPRVGATICSSLQCFLLVLHSERPWALCLERTGLSGRASRQEHNQTLQSSVEQLSNSSNSRSGLFSGLKSLCSQLST